MVPLPQPPAYLRHHPAQLLRLHERCPKSKHTLEAHRLVRRVWRTVSVFGGGRLPTDARLLQVQVTLDAAHHLRADLARVA